jgi:hypothetical protein
MLAVSALIGACSDSPKDSAAEVNDFGCEDSSDKPHSAPPVGRFDNREWIYSEHRRIGSCENIPNVVEDNSPVDFVCYALDNAGGLSDHDNNGADDQYIVVPVPTEDGLYRTSDSGFYVQFVNDTPSAQYTRVTEVAAVQVVTDAGERKVGVCTYGLGRGYRADYVVNGSIVL